LEAAQWLLFVSCNVVLHLFVQHANNMLKIYQFLLF